MQFVYRLVCHYVSGSGHQGEEVSDVQVGIFSTPGQAIAFLSAKDENGKARFEPWGTPLRYDAEEYVLDGLNHEGPRRVFRYDGELRPLGVEEATFEPDQRTTSLPPPKYSEGDVVGVIAYGHYQTGVVAHAYDHEDLGDDGCYLVDYGIGRSGGTDHVHPSESEIIPARNPSTWVLESLARLIVKDGESLAEVKARLRVR